jgi:hypothetical protein
MADQVHVLYEVLESHIAEISIERPLDKESSTLPGSTALVENNAQTHYIRNVLLLIRPRVEPAQFLVVET